MATFQTISKLKTAQDFTARLAELGVDLPFDPTLEPAGPLAQALPWSGGVIGNRFCILPMEGWDGTEDGRPSDLTRRRWENFGRSGAKLIWGGEAVAVRFDGRASPNELFLDESTLPALAGLREIVVTTHRRHHQRDDDLLVGLQLTHSGRFSKPRDKSRPEPRILYRHPVLDPRFGITDDSSVLSDDDIDRLIADYIRAGKQAQRIGFAFVDLKHCHGYLGHEFLSAFTRPGKYGGDFDNRTRFLREVVAGLRAEAPGLHLGVRLSAYDFVPFHAGPDGTGVPAVTAPYHLGFGGNATGVGIDLTEPRRFLALMESLGIELLCVSCGSPYYNPHIQRPAAFPPSDGYQPPEDPLVGVARQIATTAALKREFPRLIVVGSGYSYLQEWLPHVGQAAVRNGWADSIGLGRMVLAYPDLPADVLAGRPLQRKRICRTFSDCTTAPRNGMVSGCYPLDPFYKDRPERLEVTRIKDSLPGKEEA
jgi:2,4-dienoyl-CoA reductase-like NADH-dependent reductase (Old Yellow Enzyme family)